MTPLELRVARLISPWTGPDPETVLAWAASRPTATTPAAVDRFVTRHAEILELVLSERAEALALRDVGEHVGCARSIAFELRHEPMPKPRHRSAIIAGSVREYPDPDGERDEIAIARLARRHAPTEPWAGPIVLHLEARLPIAKSWPKWEREAAAAQRLWPCSTSAGHGGGDVDNLAKQAMDALGMAAIARLEEKKGRVAVAALLGGLGIARFWIDDAQIVELNVRKVYSPEPSWYVALYCLDEITKARWTELEAEKLFQLGKAS